MWASHRKHGDAADVATIRIDEKVDRDDLYMHSPPYVEEKASIRSGGHRIVVFTERESGYYKCVATREGGLHTSIGVLGTRRAPCPGRAAIQVI